MKNNESSNNIIDDLKIDSALATAGVESTNMFTVKTANQTIDEAKARPNPKELWMSLWFEGETCCLFADSNVGKSIYAVQIANEIAQYKKVLYFDFELSDKQFQLRYTDDDENTYKFPDTLFRVEIDPTKLDAKDFEDVVIKDIEATTIKHDCSVIILDNISYICNASDKAESAGLLMKNLMNLKRKHGWSILVLAHTPKRNLSNPITQNDLAGSKKLFNFFDSVFAIGKSAKGNDMRYIKQLKIRSGEFKYGADNVIVCSIEKDGTFLQFVQQGFDVEWNHLKERTQEDKEQEIKDIIDLHNQGKSFRKIALELGSKKSTVERIYKKHSVPKNNDDTNETDGTSGTTENIVPDCPSVPNDSSTTNGTNPWEGLEKEPLPF